MGVYDPHPTLLIAEPMAFQTSAFFPLALYQRITDVRVNNVGLLDKASERRSKPESLTYDGKLTLLAADHPARAIWAFVGKLDLEPFHEPIEAVEGVAGRPVWNRNRAPTSTSSLGTV